MKHCIKRFWQSTKSYIFMFIAIFIVLLFFGFLIRGLIPVLDRQLGVGDVIPEKNEIAEILQFGYNLTEDEADFYSMMFTKYAKKYNLDWKIYPAIITIESQWDPSAISDVGAKGLMQVMDSTFKIECFRYKKGEYAKVIALSKEYHAYEAMTLNRALNN